MSLVELLDQPGGLLLELRVRRESVGMVFAQQPFPGPIHFVEPGSHLELEVSVISGDLRVDRRRSGRLLAAPLFREVGGGRLAHPFGHPGPDQPDSRGDHLAQQRTELAGEGQLRALTRKAGIVKMSTMMPESLALFAELKSRKRLLPAFLAALLLTSACATAPHPAPVAAAAPPPAATAPAPNPYRVQVPNPGEVRRLLATYASGPYFEEVAAVYAEAGAILAQNAKTFEKPAVVLDVDETSLSNLRLYRLNDFAGVEDGPCDLVKGPCSVREWFKQPLGEPIPSAVAFVRQAREQGVAVFFITGRREETREATEKNLREAGFVWDKVIMRPNGPSHGGAADYKAPQRQRLVEAGYQILLNIGDQQSDLDGGYAEATFKLPNPFYFIP